MIKICAICGQGFEIRKSHYHLRETCSRKCSGIRRGTVMSAENSYQWKGGRKMSSDGYVLVHSPGHPRGDRGGFVREHILIECHRRLSVQQFGDLQLLGERDDKIRRLQEQIEGLAETLDRIATLSDDNPNHAKTACLVAIHEIAVDELRKIEERNSNVHPVFRGIIENIGREGT